MTHYIVKHRFHGRRKGKTLTAYRQSLLEDNLDHYLFPVISTKAGISKQIDPNFCWNDKNHETWLEIGFGNGEFLSTMSQSHPEINFIGCEPFMNGVAALLSSIEKPIDNLKIWPDDARILMDDIPDTSLNRIYLLNPDPWPKARHEKRRFIQKETLTEISRLLKPNAIFTMSTDVKDLADYMFEKTNTHPDFEWMDKTEDDMTIPPLDWPIDKTRYMKKALAGKTIYWLRFKRL